MGMSRPRGSMTCHQHCFVLAAGSLLGGWAGEVALHRAAVHGLLLGLAHAGPPTADALLRSPSWHGLLGAHCGLESSYMMTRDATRCATFGPSRPPTSRHPAALAAWHGLLGMQR